jgi:hypothetical protein
MRNGLVFERFGVDPPLITVFIPRIGIIFPLEVSILTLSRVALTVHAFPVVVHVPFAQIVRCKLRIVKTSSGHMVK